MSLQLHYLPSHAIYVLSKYLLLLVALERVPPKSIQEKIKRKQLAFNTLRT